MRRETAQRMRGLSRIGTPTRTLSTKLEQKVDDE